MRDFATLFRDATGQEPYPWQAALAARAEPPSVIEAPTGSGKTEAVVLDWMWRRRIAPERTPRRLVIALPMRVLVEQTILRLRVMSARLAAAEPGRPVAAVYPLLGGEVDNDWTLAPEAEAVLVGTIDMLLSRALNRGYGRSRAAWPIDFGLLGSDCQWVLDEVQLMDAAVATSAQLEAFRQRFGTTGPASTVWMSATLAPGWLETRDHPRPAEDAFHGLGEADRVGPLGRRLAARKDLEARPASRFARDAAVDATTCAHLEARELVDSPLTILLVNTVARAMAAADALAGRLPDVDLVLLHSRFRPGDRESLVARLAESPPPGGRVVISTQVIEAGVDLDADAMVSELAPWASMVQRAGRLNRSGRRARTRLVWLDPGPDPDQGVCRPYEVPDLLAARAALLGMAAFSPDEIAERTADQPELLGTRPETLLLRRPDLLELFDTDATLDGDDPEIGRYIRASADLDVQVAWRPLPGGPGVDEPLPSRAEVCSVPVSEAEELLRLEPWRWSYARGRWECLSSSRDRLTPGALLLVDCARGGYVPDRGWSSRSKEPVDPVSSERSMRADHDADDPATLRPDGRWIDLVEHTENVVVDMRTILAGVPLPDEEREALLLAARFHDVGKAHPAFQERLFEAAGENPGGPWAKAPRRGPRPRRVFRHEAASALALLEYHERAREADLAAYLVAAHHGKMRLFPRLVPELAGSDRLSCLGVGDGDALPRTNLGGGYALEPVRLDLSVLALGSLEETVWGERALDLLERLGPFRLAYLEALLRAADQRASEREVVDA